MVPFTILDPYFLVVRFRLLNIKLLLVDQMRSIVFELGWQLVEIYVLNKFGV